MNNPNPNTPLNPFSQAGKGNRNMRIAVISIVALHGVFFAGLLFQGCWKPSTDTARKEPDNSFLTPTNTGYGSATTLTNSAYADITNWPGYATQYGGATSNALPGGSGIAGQAGTAPSYAGRPSGANPSGVSSGTLGGGTTVGGTTAGGGIVGGAASGGTGFGAGSTVGGGTGIGTERVTETLDTTAPAVTTYKIKKGDTIAKIATANGITTKALLDANPGVDAKKLQIDKELKLPAAKKTETADKGTAEAAGGDVTLYTVKKGDTLTGIARKFGVTVPEIRKANGLKTDSIAVDKKLKIPAATKPATGGTAPPAKG